jgi:hypothetical protein
MAAPVFTQFDLLDPQSMRKKLETAHGSAVWGRFSLLSPAKAEAEVNAVSSASPKPFNNFRGVYDTKWTPTTLATAIGSI